MTKAIRLRMFQAKYLLWKLYISFGKEEIVFELYLFTVVKDGSVPAELCFIPHIIQSSSSLKGDGRELDGSLIAGHVSVNQVTRLF